MQLPWTRMSTAWAQAEHERRNTLVLFVRLLRPSGWQLAVDRVLRGSGLLYRHHRSLFSLAEEGRHRRRTGSLQLILFADHCRWGGNDDARVRMADGIRDLSFLVAQRCE